MFPLHTNTFPSSAFELQRLLNESLQRSFVTDSPPVTVRERAYPHLEAITISLDGARLREDVPHPSPVSGETSPALEIDQFTLSASPLLVGPVTLDLSLAAHSVQLRQGKDSNDQIVLSLDHAADGNIEISLSQADLEALVFKLARDQAENYAIHRQNAGRRRRCLHKDSLRCQRKLRRQAPSTPVSGPLQPARRSPDICRTPPWRAWDGAETRLDL